MRVFTLIDSILNKGVIDKDLSAPPGTPNSGDLYIVASSPTGAWTGQTKKIALFNQIWRFISPNEGITIWVNDEDKQYTYNGTNWVATASLASLNDVTITGAANNDFLVNNGTNWVNQTPSAARSSMGLGSIATQAANSVSITGGSITNISTMSLNSGTSVSNFCKYGN